MCNKVYYTIKTCVYLRRGCTVGVVACVRSCYYQCHCWILFVYLPGFNVHTCGVVLRKDYLTRSVPNTCMLNKYNLF